MPDRESDKEMDKEKIILIGMNIAIVMLTLIDFLISRNITTLRWGFAVLVPAIILSLIIRGFTEEDKEMMGEIRK